MSRNLRKKTLIRPALQLRICMTFIAAAATGLTLMLAFALVQLEGVQVGGEDVLPEVMPHLMKSYWIAMCVTIPGTLAVGILSTFLVAGPLHRFCLFLNDVIDGKQPEDCRLRTGDELSDFCALLNKATAPLRERSEDTTEPSEDESPADVKLSPADTSEAA